MTKEIAVKVIGSPEAKAAIHGVVALHKLDRRKLYAESWGLLCTDEKVTLPCTGCSCDSEYPCSCCGKRGAGCEECGYTGKRVTHFPAPVLLNGEPIEIPGFEQERM